MHMIARSLLALRADSKITPTSNQNKSLTDNQNDKPLQPIKISHLQIKKKLHLQPIKITVTNILSNWQTPTASQKKNHTLIVYQIKNKNKMPMGYIAHLSNSFITKNTFAQSYLLWKGLKQYTPFIIRYVLRYLCQDPIFSIPYI